MPKRTTLRTARDLKRSDGTALAEQLEAVLKQELTSEPPSFDEIQKRIRDFEERQERLWSTKE